ncbi:glycosyltransferase family A protein [Acutalibacter intestini]|uniref:glycosyltransferase family A protein n=1 Tax=Acutalibacter intestini TaxID=3093659 RepID=UPI002AC94709|nr:glycosyltransferase family 2 protein [Acutalibacter sp. M00204]
MARSFIPGLVSIVTPVYNGEAHLAPMLDSVLAQTYDQVEMILVDDGSTDNTFALGESYRQRFADRGYGYQIVAAPHSCAAGAMNYGLPLASGQFLVWPDSDDYLEPDSIKIRVQYLFAHPEAGAVRSLSYYFQGEPSQRLDRADERTGNLNRQNIFWDLLFFRTFVCCGCYMLRTESFFQVYPQGHIPVYPVGQNFQMLLPYLYRYSCHTLPQRLYGVCVRPGSHSRAFLSQEQTYEKYAHYERMVDELAGICGITSRGERRRLARWKFNRRVTLGFTYKDRAKIISAMELTQGCGGPLLGAAWYMGLLLRYNPAVWLAKGLFQRRKR